jgi:hypothetical protein
MDRCQLRKMQILLVQRGNAASQHCHLSLVENSSTRKTKTKFFTFNHSIANLQCFPFLISVKYVIIFNIFDKILKFSVKKFTFSFVWNLWNLYQSLIGRIRIGMPWIPIPIRQSDADLMRSGSGSRHCVGGGGGKGRKQCW